MEHTVAVIAVTDEGVTTRLFSAGVDDGTIGSQLAIDVVGPFLVGVIGAAQDAGACFVAKVGAEFLRCA